MAANSSTTSTMAGIQLSDIELLAAVTLIACIQMATFAKRVGWMRMKHKVNVPTTDGHPEFVRSFRAQQNSVEFFGIFLACLWVSGLFCHQAAAAVVGLVYCLARESYFRGYIREPKGRRRGFGWSVRCLFIYMIMMILGIGSFISLHHFQKDLKTPTLNYLNKNVVGPAYVFLEKEALTPAWAFIKKNLMESGGKGGEL